MVSHEDSEAWSVAIELHSKPGAEDQLVGAIVTASETNNVPLEAQARAALGMDDAHHGRMPDAIAHLERSLELMKKSPGADRDAVSEYLDLIERKQVPTVGPGSATAEAIREFVLERSPARIDQSTGRPRFPGRRSALGCRSEPLALRCGSKNAPRRDRRGSGTLSAQGG